MKRALWMAVFLVVVPVSTALAQVTGITCGSPFAPSGRVPGTSVSLPPSGARVTIPAGWGWEPRKGADGSPFILVSAPAAGASGLVILAASDNARDKTLEQWANETSNQLANGSRGNVVASNFFGLRHHCGLQVIFRTAEVEGYVVVVRAGERVYAVAARYALDGANVMHAGLDTIVASAILPAPAAAAPSAAAANPAANSGAPSIVGCWEGLSSAFFHTYYFAPDGTYREHTSPRAGEVGTRPHDAYGRYFVQGDSVNIIPNEGEPWSLLISVSDNQMRLGRRYLRCR